MYDEDNENEGYPLLAMSGLNLIITEKPQVFASSVMLKPNSFNAQIASHKEGLPSKIVGDSLLLCNS